MSPFMFLSRDNHRRIVIPPKPYVSYVIPQMGHFLSWLVFLLDKLYNEFGIMYSRRKMNKENLQIHIRDIDYMNQYI